MSKTLAVLLLALMVVMNLPLAFSASPPSQTEATEAVQTGQETIGAHLATQADVDALMAEFGVYDPNTDYNVIIDGFGTGLSPPRMETYQNMVGKVMFYPPGSPAPVSTLPNAVDHSTEPCFPVVDSQGGMGSCGSWATVYYAAGYLQGHDNGWTEAYSGANKSQLLSPLWAFNKLNYDSTQMGSNTWDNADVLASVGCSDWANMPYSDSDFHSWGREGAWRIAPKYRTLGYDMASPTDIDVIKSWIAEGNVVPMAFDAYNYDTGLGSGDAVMSSIEYNDIWGSNHANCIVGYNDSVTADGEVGAFKIVNSWGSWWGWEWNGYGYWWMTYDAFRELSYPVIVMHDRVDYEPSLLATWNISSPCSKDTSFELGTDSGAFLSRTPFWYGSNSYDLPNFMALDITEFADEVGLSSTYLLVGAGAKAGTISKFTLEWQGKVALSGDTPARVPNIFYARFQGLHINISYPPGGSLVGGDVLVAGNCSPYMNYTILEEDFEGNWEQTWNNNDYDPRSGIDFWGSSDHRSSTGFKSAWAGGSDRYLYHQDFDDYPAVTGWATRSAGPNSYPFVIQNSGYQGTSGTDFVAVANSNRGGGTNITEYFYMNQPVNASSFSNLELSVYLSYDFNDGGEYAQVLYSTDATYPAFTLIANYTTDILGTKIYDLSLLDHRMGVYIGFCYHGTNDRFMVVDDVMLRGDKERYDNNMSALFYKDIGDLRSYDNVTVEYSYWVDSQTGVDNLYCYYQDPLVGSWNPLAQHTGVSNGWVNVSVKMPTNASYLGFRFLTDGTVSYEGAYIDNVRIIGHHDLDDLSLKVDSGTWASFPKAAAWSMLWDSSSFTDGDHTLYIRATYNGLTDLDPRTLRTDNSPPSWSGIGNELLTTGDISGYYITATDMSGISLVNLNYTFDQGDSGNVTVTYHIYDRWTANITSPSNSTSVSYRFHIIDGFGNGLFTSLVIAPVADNDAPALSMDLTSSMAESGDPFTFKAAIEDNIRVVSTYVEYWFGTGKHTTLLEHSGSLEKTISVATLDPLYYQLSAVDPSNNWYVGPVELVNVTDNDPPMFGADESDLTATTNDTFRFLITATDNVEVANITVEYWFDTGAHTVIGLDIDGAIIQTQTTPGQLNYIFKVTDTAGNSAVTLPRSVSVIDNDPPVMVDLSKATAGTGETYLIDIHALDNAIVRSAQVEYWFRDGPHTLKPMAGAYQYQVSIPANSLDHLTYFIRLSDASDNTYVSPERVIGIIDIIPPTLGTDMTQGPATIGHAFKFLVNATDNIGVASAQVSYWFDGGLDRTNAQMFGTGPYHLYVLLPSDHNGSLHYQFSVTDQAGIKVNGSEATVPLLAPIINTTDDDDNVTDDDVTPDDDVNVTDDDIQPAVIDNENPYSAGFWALLVLIGIAVVVLIVVLIVIFVVLRRKDSRKGVDDEEYEDWSGAVKRRRSGRARYRGDRYGYPRRDITRSSRKRSKVAWDEEDEEPEHFARGRRDKHYFDDLLDEDEEPRRGAGIAWEDSEEDDWDDRDDYEDKEDTDDEDYPEDDGYDEDRSDEISEEEPDEDIPEDNEEPISRPRRHHDDFGDDEWM